MLKWAFYFNAVHHDAAAAACVASIARLGRHLFSVRPTHRVCALWIPWTRRSRSRSANYHYILSSWQRRPPPRSLRAISIQQSNFDTAAWAHGNATHQSNFDTDPRRFCSAPYSASLFGHCGCFSLPLRFLALAPSKMEVVLVDTTSTTGDVHVQRMKHIYPDSKKAANWKEVVSD